MCTGVPCAGRDPVWGGAREPASVTGAQAVGVGQVPQALRSPQGLRGCPAHTTMLAKTSAHSAFYHFGILSCSLHPEGLFATSLPLKIIIFLRCPNEGGLSSQITARCSAHHHQQPAPILPPMSFLCIQYQLGHHLFFLSTVATPGSLSCI